MKKFKNINLNWLFLLVFVISFIVPFVIFIFFYSKNTEFSFPIFITTLFSTYLGALVGIPTALWVLNIKESQTEKERKTKILSLLLRELMVNYGTLIEWNKKDARTVGVLSLICFLRDELWVALSDGGELQWIKDPILLSDISYAYSSMRIVKDLAEKYFNLICRPQSYEPTIVEMIIKQIENGTPVATNDILKVLNKLGNDENPIK